MDEIAVWTRALSEDEIRPSWYKKLEGNEAWLVGYWDFDDGTASDAARFEFDGELNGDAMGKCASFLACGEGSDTMTLLLWKTS